MALVLIFLFGCFKYKLLSYFYFAGPSSQVETATLQCKMPHTHPSQVCFDKWLTLTAELEEEVSQGKHTIHGELHVTECLQIKVTFLGKKKKIRDTKGTFHAKMGSIKDRNGMDLTEVEDIKKR